MFDLERVKKESGLPLEKLTLVEKKVREEFQDDVMMFELHFLRTVRALKEGLVTLEQVLNEPITA